MDFDFRGDCQLQKLKTAKIYAHVYQSELQKFGDVKIFQCRVYVSLNSQKMDSLELRHIP